MGFRRVGEPETMIQTKLSDSWLHPHEALEGSQQCHATIDTNLFLPKVMTVTKAKEWAENVVRHLPCSSTFTSQAFFSRVRLLGDKRGRGAVIRHLRALGLITAHSITREDQESRNNGLAVRWKVIKNE